VSDAGLQHHGQRSPTLGEEEEEEEEEEEGWRRRRRVVVVLLVIGVSLADFGRGSTQSFLHRCTAPTTPSSALDSHTEEYRMCEITSFMKY